MICDEETFYREAKHDKIFGKGDLLRKFELIKKNCKVFNFKKDKRIVDKNPLILREE
jgi:hypothetical protein